MERVEKLLIGSLRERVTQDGLQDLIDYHGLLEKVRHLSHDASDSKATSAETDFFLRKAQELSKLVSAMEILEPSQGLQLREISEKLRELSSFVEEDKCLNAGGKFEWVDSILVKCLREGSWLLVDQVNLCSPAVLDRLNGLLEPGGVLAIGERGVDADGNVVTIEPHRDFRLFLTMDPKYGEISRAMRNRGVEVFMLDQGNPIDLKSLLFNSGLTACNHQEVLLKVQDVVSREVSATWKLGTTQLLHAAFLVTQQVRRGFPAKRAVKSACVDVYVKAGSIQHQQAKSRLISRITEVVDSEDFSEDSKPPLDFESATLSVFDLKTNSTLARIRQQGVLIKAIIDNQSALLKHLGTSQPSEATTEFLNALFDLPDNDKRRLVGKFSQIFPHLMLGFYEQSSEEDLEIRYKWLSRMLTDADASFFKAPRDKSTLLANEVARFRFRFADKSLPFDPVELPNAARSVIRSERVDDSNRLALLLYLRLSHVSTEVMMQELQVTKHEKVMSVLQYSNAVYYNKLTPVLKSQPLITNFVTFCTLVEKCVDHVLRNNALAVDFENYADLRRNLKWCDRFYILGELTLIDKINKSKNINNNVEEVALLLRVHYKWLVKFLKKWLARCGEAPLHPKSEDEVGKLISTIENFNEELALRRDPFRKISKSIKKHLHLPLPYSSESIVTAYPSLKKLSNAFSTHEVQTDKLKWSLRMLLLQEKNVKKGRAELIDIWKEIYLTRSLEEASLSKMAEIEQISANGGLNLRTSSEISDFIERTSVVDNKEIPEIISKVQLWPVQEYMFLLFANAICGTVFELSGRSSILSDAPRLLSRFSEIPSIPGNLLAVLGGAIEKGIEELEERNRLLPELFVFLDRLNQNSSAIKDFTRVLHWRGPEEDAEEDAEEETRGQPVNGPVLVGLTAELILNKSPNKLGESILATATLGTYRARMNQLKTLNDTLWMNAASLNSRHYKYASSDLEMLKSSLHLFLSAVLKMEAECDLERIFSTEAGTTIKADDVGSDYYVKSYREPLQDLRSLAETLRDAQDPDDVILERSKAWSLLGYLNAFLFGNLGFIDPVHKVRLKLQYAEEDIMDHRCGLYVALLRSRIVGDDQGNNLHPRALQMEKDLEELMARKEDLKSLKAIRPPTLEFIALSKEVANFRYSLGEVEIVRKHIERLSGTVRNLRIRFITGNVNSAIEAIRKTEMWRESLRRFSIQVENKYLPGYPDIVLPLTAAVAQLTHGANLLIDECKKLITMSKTGLDPEEVEAIMSSLVGFPRQLTSLALFEVCTSETTKELIDNTLKSTSIFLSLQEQFRVMKSGLSELYNYVVSKRTLSKSLWADLNALLQQVVLIWKQQEKEEETLAAEKESLYKNKARVRGEELTEEEEMKSELRRLFPTYRDVDFSDIERGNENSLERVESSADPEERYGGLITDEDVLEVQRMHSDIVKGFTSSAWLKKSPDLGTPDYVEPLIQRYRTFGLLLETLMPGFDCEFSSKLHTSLNFLTTLTARASDGKNASSGLSAAKKSYDFYKDSNVEETKQCLPLLEGILERTLKFLHEWPEHPTLRSIRDIVHRTFGFSVTSSVFRFLTGLELLLTKMKEWEENAHSGVSLSEYTLLLTQQIVSWRKLELDCWKSCLEEAQRRLRDRTSKWWFFLYALIEGYVNGGLPEDEDSEKEPSSQGKNDPISKKTFVESLDRFMGESSLVEFEARLDLLLTFHCHVYYMNPSRNKDEVLAILWNIYNYYGQFCAEVRKKIEILKTPIEKKLKDFVKIARWNDISYWAVKETVEKTHRTLHKFVKEFETGLKESVSPCLQVKPSSTSSGTSKGIWDQPEKFHSINPADFVAALPGKMNEDVLVTAKRLSRTGNLFVKARRYCKESILMSSYPSLRTDVEQLAEEFLERSTRLKNLEVDRTLPKEKQKSHARSILQQKKMALSDYFKTLSSLGVSHRVGTLSWRNKQDEVLDLMVPPLHLPAALQEISLIKADAQMLSQWEGCDRYYYNSLVKLNALNVNLLGTKTDLGAQNLERCRGFSSHLMLMANGQKRAIVEALDSFVALRRQLSNLSSIDGSNSDLPGQKSLNRCAGHLKLLLVTLQGGLDQLKLYLEACPENNPFSAEEETIVLDKEGPKMVFAKRDDPVWLNAKKLVADSLNLLLDLAKRFESLIPKVEDHEETNLGGSSVFLFTSLQFKFLAKSFETVDKVRGAILNLAEMFSGDDESHHPIARHITWLESEAKRGIDEFRNLEAQGQSEENLSDEAITYFEGVLESLISSILLVIQKKYKENLTYNEELPAEEESAENNNGDLEEAADELEQNKLKEKLIEHLEADIKELNLKSVHRHLNHILSILCNLPSEHSTHCGRLLKRCLPLLEQYLLFSQFYLNEQVASFRVTCKLLYLQLNVFLDLATNGFCVPRDLDMEEDNGEGTESVDRGGMGLGEGEGQKDVSDRIETEDQLDDARRADEETEEVEDKDCKEEEKGIDMSENFDSKLQDLEKEGDEGDGEEEDEEMDKEIGETEEGADKLDEEIWGDDNEEEEEKEADDKQEERGKGEEIGQEMGAKDEDEAEGSDPGEDRERKEEKKKDINEFEEPEVDDDQIDPYHGNQQPEPEPEVLDLPEDMNLDGEEGKDNDGPEEENPFDIDQMKEDQSPPEKDAEEPKVDEEKKDPENVDDSSDEEDDAKLDPDQASKEEKEEDANESERDAHKQGTEKGTEEEEKEDEDGDAEEEATPSSDAASKATDAAEQIDDKQSGSRDKVAQQSRDKDQEEAAEENGEGNNEDKGVGQSQSENNESGHVGNSAQESRPSSLREHEDHPAEKRRKPGESDENRSLVDKFEPDKKKLKTIHSAEKRAENKGEELSEEEKHITDTVQHVKKTEKFDDLALDAATEDQVKQQASNLEEKQDEEKEDEPMDVDVHEDEEIEVDDATEKQGAEKVPDGSKEEKANTRQKGSNIEEGTAEQVVEVEGELATTEKVDRGHESAFYTNLTPETTEITRQVESRRLEIEKMLGRWVQVPSTEEAMAAWNSLSMVTETQARDLSEKLRLVLEPTQASRLKGDYRTGRRINMRKIIPYIASQFRKDKIWLRRTKPSKRDYQIVLAIDDSSSMADNHSKELAFESLALICKAMSYLEVGQLCVVSFGEEASLLHRLGEPFTEQSGSRLIQDMKFDQKKTMVGQLVDFTVDMFESQNSSSDNAKLLVVLSDGRGVFSEGIDRVHRAVRRARLSDIFLVFIIVDNPLNKDSILDIRMPIFEGGKLLGIRSYMDSFPFPFYMIARDVNALPGLLSDALRQWFEVVGKIDS
ncbi:midasin-like [Orussus abietinus]|uniref:midasin-like n=1 Tax=Orussus abietinus TaxID=222816 RepID=UPI000C715DCB|nr:midasin-like [Orussus abietinus]